MWEYLDDAGLRQGPFTTANMRGRCAAGYLAADRQVRQICLDRTAHTCTGKFDDLANFADLSLDVEEEEEADARKDEL